MRLLNTDSLQFQEFFDEQRPQYAILSHRWTSDETTYKDFSKGRKQESKGHRKVLAFCEFAKARDHEWVWVDTCCIDKRSSAELSEAINSMYRWYKHASMCYAYLADVPCNSSVDTFCGSSWFTRGWTVQELLAPLKGVEFCDADWSVIGNRHSMSDIISRTTGIDPRYLGPSSSDLANVATKMSWFSKRQTTRTEDLAYCMLGIFDLNLPLLYGEGEKAFLRLQTEIIRKCNDHSIFAWGLGVRYHYNPWMLARSPKSFTEPITVNLRGAHGVISTSASFDMTKLGIELRVPWDMWLIHPAEKATDEHYLDTNTMYCEFRLYCYTTVQDQIPCILLERDCLSRRPSLDDSDPEKEERILWFRHRIRLRSLQAIETIQMSKPNLQAATVVIYQPPY